MTNQSDGTPAPGSPTVLAMPASNAPEGSGLPTEPSPASSAQLASPVSPTPDVQPAEGSAPVDAGTAPTTDRDTVAEWISSAPWSEVIAIPRINRAIDRESQRLVTTATETAKQQAAQDTLRTQVEQLKSSGQFEQALQVQTQLMQASPPAAPAPAPEASASTAPGAAPAQAVPPADPEAPGLSLVTSLPTQAARGEMVDVMLRYNSSEDWPLVLAEHARIKAAHAGETPATPEAPASAVESVAAAQSAAAVQRDTIPAPSAGVGTSAPTGRVFSDPGELRSLSTEERQRYFHPNGLPRAGTVLQVPNGYVAPQRGGVIHGGG